jgi:3-oxoacyl-[acyl-carrier-protein] synthase-3
MMSPHVEHLRGLVAIVGSELGSTLLDFGALAQDRSQWVNLVQMGDGAGAIVLGPLTGTQQSRIEFAFYGCRGRGAQPGISIPEGGSGAPALSTGSVPLFRHDFAAVKRDGLELLREGMITIGAAGYSLDDFTWIIPHQANGRMHEICQRRLGLPAERIVCDAHELGNLGSAAIWVSFDRLRRSGRLHPGERVLVLGAEASKFMFGGFVYTHGRS